MDSMIRVADERWRPIVEAVLRNVAGEYDLPVAALLGRSRAWEVVDARRVAMLALARFGLTYKEIGFTLRRHYSTVIHHMDYERHPERRRRPRLAAPARERVA